MSVIEVSCPSCGKINIINMKLLEPMKGGFLEMLEQIVEDVGIKHYCFSGKGKCIGCNESIDVSVNVVNQNKEKIK